MIQRIGRRELLLNQIKNNKLSRLDIIVRWCFMNSIGTEQYMFFRELYRKMQFMRTGHDNHTKGVPWVEQFLLLDRSFREKGYISDYPLIVNQDKHLINSSHRAALCMYHKLDDIPIMVCEDWQKHLEKSGSKTKTYFNYGIDWFEENNFSHEEIQVIKNMKNILFENLNLFFYVILWPSASQHHDGIVTDIKRNHNVLSARKYKFDKSLPEFVRKVYEIDDIEDWKIKKKIEHMINHAKDDKTTILKVDLFSTKFRHKTKHPDKLIAIDAEEIKKQIRQKYRAKVDSYFYDVIIHMSDNYQQVDHISSLLEECSYDS